MNNEWWRRQIEIERRTLRMEQSVAEVAAKVVQTQGIAQAISSGLTGWIRTTGFVPDQNYPWQLTRMWWKAEWDDSQLETVPPEWRGSDFAAFRSLWNGREVDMGWRVTFKGISDGMFIRWYQEKWPPIAPPLSSSATSETFANGGQQDGAYSDPSAGNTILVGQPIIQFYWSWKEGCMYARPPGSNRSWGLYTSGTATQTYVSYYLDYNGYPTNNARNPYVSTKTPTFAVGLASNVPIPIDAGNPPFYGTPGSMTINGVASQTVFWEGGTQSYSNGSYQDPNQLYPQAFLPDVLKGQPPNTYVPAIPAGYSNGHVTSTPATITIRWE